MRICKLKQFVIDQMKEYQHRNTMIKAVKYQHGMENGYILRFYKSNTPVLSGAIICNTLEQAETESKEPTREKFCLNAENQQIPVVYDKPVPIIITHKHTDEEKELLLEAGYLPFTPFLDDNENDYVFEEITEEECWIVKNLLNGEISTESEYFMQEYELMEDKLDSKPKIYYEDYRLRVVENNGKYTIYDSKYGWRAIYKDKSKEWTDEHIQRILTIRNRRK